MASHNFPGRLRVHRNKSWLSQREVAQVLGYANHLSVMQHERGIAVPPFLTALGYEAIFRVSASELFPGFYDTVVNGIETRLAELERSLGESAINGRNERKIAAKQEWLRARLKDGF